MLKRILVSARCEGIWNRACEPSAQSRLRTGSCASFPLARNDGVCGRTAVSLRVVHGVDRAEKAASVSEHSEAGLPGIDKF